MPEAEGRVLGPVPIAELVTTARVLRPGRSVALVQAELHDLAAGRPVARATGWPMPDPADGPRTQAVAGDALDHGPEDGLDLERPPGWLGGYLDVEWRWISGSPERPGPGVVWMRSPDLVEGEAITPVQRLLTCVDSASGIGSALEVDRWRFLNTELTVHDRVGVVARSAQTLLVTPR